MEQKWANNLNIDEFNLIQSTWYPQLKKNATEKIKAQLFELGKELENAIPGNGFKISSGENYKGLPYLVLDFPKISGPQFPVLFRTLFWWGKYVSFQVFILKSKINGKQGLLFDLLSETDWILIQEDLWSNNIHSGDFVKKGELDVANLLDTNGEYLKFMRVVDMKKPDNLFEEAIGFYQNFYSYLLTS